MSAPAIQTTSPSTSAPRKNPYLQPAFVCAFAILITAAAGLNLAVGELQLHFKKLAVPLARPLTDIPVVVGDWIQVSRDAPLDHDIQEVLGTDKYIFRDYLYIPSQGGSCAASLIEALHDGDDPAHIAALRRDYLAASPADRITILKRELSDLGKSSETRRKALGVVQMQAPDAVINMAVTYYTGLVDTVAHVPDRCYIADGFEPTDYVVPAWIIPGRKDPLSVRFINFEDQSGAARISRSVAYFFHVNGHYESDSLAVRRSLQNLLEKYGYYAKVELMTLDPDHERSARTMTSFLGAALPEVEKSFPDWNKLHR